jgi:transporter family-2 protein
LKTILIGAVIALITGITIGIQVTFISRAGGILGSIKTGLITNLMGGSLAGIIILIMLIFGSSKNWKVPAPAFFMMITAGLLGILIVTGVSFSLQRAGIAAGMATVILGQMLISIIIDTKGIGGIEPIAISFQRIAGIILMGISVYLLLPKN